MDQVSIESWRTFIDKFGIGRNWNDKINNKCIDEFISNPKAKEILVNYAKDIKTILISDLRKEGKYELSKTKVSEKSLPRRFQDTDDFCYVRNIGEYQFVIVTNGEYIKSIHYLYALKRKSDGKEEYEFQQIIAQD